ncbi:acyl carrier protein [Phenylobacterium sp.]|jgi:acyl carrier protein|uniref:acyl carrier protein n=1 Tax=Phenylobacterium sp. TaxID=1871053 RepID=UPI0037C9372F
MDEVFRRVATVASGLIICRIDTLSPETRLEALGLQSSDFVDLLFALEDEFGVEIPDVAVGDASLSTLGGITQAIEREIRRAQTAEQSS